MKSGITMTCGSLYKNILLFSIPLMFSNLLQVLFNMSDIAVVGRFAGANALGAVGSCATLVQLFTGLLIGMGSGINALVARFAGAKDYTKLEKTIHTSLVISIIYGLLIMAFGLVGAHTMLSMLNTKNILMEDSVIYIIVYLLGTPALSLYNFGNGVLCAVGDSRRPLLYLAISGVVNVALNLLFVIVFKMGVLGVALASALAQYLSAALILIRLFTCGEYYGIKLKKIHLDATATKTILMLGLPAALQNAIFSVANLFIQAGVNSFDATMVAGNSAAANADGIVYESMYAVYAACTSFMAQNYGAQIENRTVKSYKICLLYSFGIGAIFGGLLLIFERPFLSLFTTEAAVIDAGMKRLVIMSCSYCVSAFMDCTIAASRGIGKTVIPTVIVVLGSCVFRIVWIYTIFAHYHTIPSLYLLYIFSWTVTALGEIIYFIKAFKQQMAKLAPVSIQKGPVVK